VRVQAADKCFFHFCPLAGGGIGPVWARGG